MEGVGNFSKCHIGGRQHCNWAFPSSRQHRTRGFLFALPSLATSFAPHCDPVKGVKILLPQFHWCRNWGSGHFGEGHRAGSQESQDSKACSRATRPLKAFACHIKICSSRSLTNLQMGQKYLLGWGTRNKLKDTYNYNFCANLTQCFTPLRRKMWASVRCGGVSGELAPHRGMGTRELVLVWHCRSFVDPRLASLKPHTTVQVGAGFF